MALKIIKLEMALNAVTILNRLIEHKPVTTHTVLELCKCCRDKAFYICTVISKR